MPLPLHGILSFFEWKSASSFEMMSFLPRSRIVKFSACSTSSWIYCQNNENAESALEPRVSNPPNTDLIASNQEHSGTITANHVESLPQEPDRVDSIMPPPSNQQELAATPVQEKNSDPMETDNKDPPHSADHKSANKEGGEHPTALSHVTSKFKKVVSPNQWRGFFKTSISSREFATSYTQIVSFSFCG